MKVKIELNPIAEIVAEVRKAVADNDGYCPCIYQSKGKVEYLCPCEDFRTKTPVGKKCHCGLYIKDEM